MFYKCLFVTCFFCLKKKINAFLPVKCILFFFAGNENYFFFSFLTQNEKNYEPIWTVGIKHSSCTAITIIKYNKHTQQQHKFIWIYYTQHKPLNMYALCRTCARLNVCMYVCTKKKKKNDEVWEQKKNWNWIGQYVRITEIYFRFYLIIRNCIVRKTLHIYFKWIHRWHW